MPTILTTGANIRASNVKSLFIVCILLTIFIIDSTYKPLVYLNWIPKVYCVSSKYSIKGCAIKMENQPIVFKGFY